MPASGQLSWRGAVKEERRVLHVRERRFERQIARQMSAQRRAVRRLLKRRNIVSRDIRRCIG